MLDFDECGELVLCDIVVCVIDYEMKCLGVDCMFFDISYKFEVFVCQYFLMIYEKLFGLGIDLIKELVLVVFVVYYICGGVMVDDNGCIDVDGLYVIGEVSYIGLYGVNCMVLNLLLECLVYGWFVVEDIIWCLLFVQKVVMLLVWDESQVEILDELVVIQYNWYELCLLMWDYVGIVCIICRLECVLWCIIMFQQELDEYYVCFCVLNNLLELCNLVQVVEFIVCCVMLCKESCGLYYIFDYLQLLFDSGLLIFLFLVYIKR